MHNFYPWQQNVLSGLLQRRQQNNLPHALLLHGSVGLGKHDFALAFAELLLCDSSENSACGECAKCKLIKAGNHPDLYLIRPETKDQPIKIDQIRELNGALAQTAQQCGYQIVIIHPAENMNVAAANALLKTLEEPVGAKVLFMLVSNNAALLLATIRSRCQKVTFTVPDLPTAKNWLLDNANLSAAESGNVDVLLALADNAPLRVLSCIADKQFSLREELLCDCLELCMRRLNIVSFAAKYVNCDLRFFVTNAMLLVNDLLKIQHNAGLKWVTNQDKLADLQKLSSMFSTAQAAQYLDALFATKSYFERGVNFNKQLLLENLALGMQQLFI